MKWMFLEETEMALNPNFQSVSLADLENFHSEDGMILANATPIGMQPKLKLMKLSFQRFFILLIVVLRKIAYPRK